MKTESQTGEYLVFAIADSLFAVPAAQVESAVAPRQVTPLPFVPAFVEGLVNVNDRIMPLLDLRALLASETAIAARGELVVVDSARSPCAWRVDRVVATVVPDAAEICVAGAMDENAETQFVSSRFTHAGRTVLVLDADALAARVGAQAAVGGRRGLLGSAGVAHQQAVQGENSVAEQTCILVRCGSETYGIALADALEILDIPAGVPVPGAPACVEGVALVRGDVVLVLSLAVLLGRPAGTQVRNVIVVEHEGYRFGLRVDAVDGILAYADDAWRGIDEDGGELCGVVVAAERAIGLVTAARVFTPARLRTLAPYLPARGRRTQAVQEATQSVLEVACAGESLGIPLNAVRRIAGRNATDRQSAGGDDAARGVVNIDGVVLPVLDLSASLGSVVVAGAAQGAWIVVGDNAHEWALPVQEARRIVEVPLSAVEAIGHEPGALIQAVARVDARLMSLLSIAPLLEAA